MENNGRVDVFDHEGRSALHLAADNGSIEVCEALLNKNAFINSKAKTGWTSFHFALTFVLLFVYFWYFGPTLGFLVLFQSSFGSSFGLIFLSFRPFLVQF